MLKTFLLSLLISSMAIIGSCTDDEATTPTTSGLVLDVPDGVPLNGGLQSAATDGEDAWGFVRQSATWGDANSQFVDELLVNLSNSQLLQSPGTYTDTDATVNNQSVTIRLTVDANTTVSTASAFIGALTFTKKFEIWRNSDNAKALEFFFDDSSSLGANGVLLYYQPNVLAPAEFTGDNVIVESYSFDTDEGRKQTYSWSGGAIVSGGSGQAGRVILEEMSGGSRFCFKAVVQMNGSLNWCPPSGNNEYYSLAYTQVLDTPNAEVTAKFGYLDDAIDGTGEICSGTANSLNFGLFQRTGFVGDTFTSFTPNYPPATRVNALFSELGTTGAGVWDDTSKAKIDGLNIQFVSTAAP